MEFKFLKLRDLQGKTPSFPAAGEVHIIYVPEPDDSNLHKAGAGRAMIREILSYYLCIDKGLVCLHESRHGKPYLASPAIGRNLYFNISHTEGYLAFAMSTSTPLGIDIEKVDRNVRLQSLMGRFFHAKEIKKFLDYSDEERVKHFIHYWTLKESFVKGLGTGMTTSFTSFYLRRNPNVHFTSLRIKKTSRTNIHPGESLPFLLPKGLSAVLLTGSHKRPHHIAGQPPGLLMFRRRPLLLDSAPPLPESLLTRRIHLSQESTSPRLPYESENLS